MTAGPFSKETVGEFLRRERESRRVALEEISKSTRISRPYLEALERNDFRFFSKPEYIQGFLRGYARYIGLDPDEVLKRYEFQLDLARLKGNFHQLPLFSSPGDSTETAEVKPSESPSGGLRTRQFPIPRSILIQILVLVAALSISFYLYLTLKRLDHHPLNQESEVHSDPAAANSEKDRNGKPAPQNISGKNLGEDKAPNPSVASGAGGSGIRTGDKEDSKRIQAATLTTKVLGDPESKIYYLPGMKDYGKARKGRGVVEFGSEEEAKKKGYRRAFR